MMQIVVPSLVDGIRAGILIIAALAPAACAADTSEARPHSVVDGPTAPSSSKRHNVAVTRLRVFLQSGRPHAYVEGELGDGCTSLERVTQRRAENLVTMTFSAVRQGEVCTEQMQLLNAWVALDGPFAPGEYVVRANAVTVRFRLVAAAGGDLRLDPDPGPPPPFPEPPPDTTLQSSRMNAGDVGVS